MKMAVVKVQNLSKRFGENEVLKSVSIDFEAGRIYALVG